VATPAVTDLLVLATEGGIPTSNPWSQLALPLGILIFVGSVYLLIRSNLGTRRGYLVMSTSLWGFGFLLSLFWAFGAPGTPPNTGPQNLPGQELDEYQPVWIPFAGDSAVVTEEGSPYAVAAGFPDGFTEVPAAFEERASVGVQNTQSFFSSLDAVEGAEEGTYFNILDGTEVVVEGPLYAEAENGRPIIGVTFASTCQLEDPPEDAPEGAVAELPGYCEGLEVGEAIPADAVDDDGNPVRTETTLFAFFDAGAPYFPSILMASILFVLFAVHMLLLYRDERREHLEAQEVAEETVQVEERAPVSV
jgi:hypothetical protein